MKFLIEAVSKEGGRLASMTEINHHGNKVLETPACLLYTRGGAVPNLTLDMLQDIPNMPGGIQMAVPSLLNSKDSLEKFGKGVANFTGNNNAVTYVSVQDPGQKVPSGYNDKNTISVWITGGRVKLDSASFLSFQEACQPDIWEALCDGDTPSGCSKKRILRSVSRTLDYLDICLEHKLKSKNLQNSELLGVIEGGELELERLKSAKETAKRPVSGFVLDAFGEEDITPAETRWGLMNKVIGELPEGKPRLLPHPSSPLEVLKAVEHGVDLFTTSYPHQLALANQAFVFPLQQPIEKQESVISDKNEIKDPVVDGETSEASLSINLSDKRYFEDLSPVLKGCTCYCCRNHSRAYINHLLITKEMLAKVLLTCHNIHHYLAFFAEIRKAIRSDSYDNLKNNIMKIR